MIEFFLPIVPPTATAQGHKLNTRGKRPRFYDPHEVKQMKATFAAWLPRYKPEKPMLGPIRLTTKWIWPGDTNRYKDTVPDTDNFIKAFKDAMTKAGFWKNDAQVACEITEKWWDPRPGIYVRVEHIGNMEHGN